MSEQSSKTEQPTEKRLREAHAEGQFARVPDLNVVFILIAAAMMFLFTAKEYTSRIAGISVGLFGQLGKYALNPDSMSEWVSTSVMTMLGFVVPMGAVCALASILAGGLQSRFRLSPKALEPKLSRLNPAKGFSRVFSAQGWVKLATDSAKLAVVGMIVWSALKKIMADPLFYTPVAPYRLGSFIYDTALTLIWRFVLALGCVGAFNYVYQLRRIQKELMMSKQEVKEENRSAEGDPHVRMARRQMARRLMQKQMLSAVPTADVVVTNPTHFAVALKYERGADKAPVVLAKGERLFARRIKELAASHQVPMIENKPVARMLFKYGRVGHPIPTELYQAVADILAFVYRTHRLYFHELKHRRDEFQRAQTNERRAKSNLE
jgi:flagellar biosynthetic protein FlhB